jgi:DNA replication and repair protein RecF
VGKTNLLEAIHVATQGFSPRTRTDSQVVRFGAEGARAAVAGRRGEVGLEFEVTVRRGEGKRARLNGAPLRAAEQLRGLVATLVFTPDRLGVVKGPPAARRAYFDRVLGRFAPARAPLPTEYGAAVAQRNAALRRAAAGVSGRDAVEPWSERVATLGVQLVEARLETLALLEPPFAAHADGLGLGEVSLRYEGEPPTPEGMAAALDRDLERGVTSLGPHLDDVSIAADGRDLRSFGSQGEQRLALLALLLAEAETIADRTGVPPLLLLDDVLSELDPGRRRILAARVRSAGQALVTATDQSLLPAAPDQLLEVTPGTVLEAVA